MARITSFEIKGLAGRRKAVSHELGDLAVFWGLNGSGKTSLLKILHSALTCDATSLLRVPFTSAEVQIDDGRFKWVRTIAKSDFTESEVALRHLDSEEGEVWSLAEVESMARWKTKVTGVTHVGGQRQPQPYPGVHFRHGYLPISRVSERRIRPGRHQSSAEVLDEAAFDRMFAQQIRELWSEYNQRALMQIRTAQESGIAGILNSVLTPNSRRKSAPKIDVNDAYNLISGFFSNQRFGAMVRLSRESFSENYETNQTVRRIVAEVADVQRGIELAQEPQQRIVDLVAELYSGSKELVLEGREVKIVAGESNIPLESLSSGEKQMLQLLLECLAAGANPVIIDEPELSMHVDWQNRLVNCLRTVNENCQLIMATHSPEVMAELDDKVIIEL